MAVLKKDIISWLETELVGEKLKPYQKKRITELKEGTDRASNPCLLSPYEWEDVFYTFQNVWKDSSWKTFEDASHKWNYICIIVGKTLDKTKTERLLKEAKEKKLAEKIEFEEEIIFPDYGYSVVQLKTGKEWDEFW